ncbi:hypothetical protein TYRP_002188 [Tyrophagus putrescentiae]|nr:hypothetical protein TYRP_002188 [Tyrophagus putrescentiae]
MAFFSSGESVFALYPVIKGKPVSATSGKCEPKKEHRETADFRAQGQNRCVRASSREFGVLFEAQEKKETEKRIEKRQCGSSASTGERVPLMPTNEGLSVRNIRHRSWRALKL